MAKLTYTFPKFFITITRVIGLDKAIMQVLQNLVRELEKLHREITKTVNTNAGDNEFVDITAFNNSWVNFGGGASTAGYRFISDGIVLLNGTVKTGTAGTSVFTLPASYRPDVDMIFAIVSSAGIFSCTVDTAGDVIPEAAAGNTKVILDGLIFSVST